MKQITLPNSNLYLEGNGLDVNGNRIVKLGMSSMKNAFSIQTAGILPKTHSLLRGLTKKDFQGLSAEALTMISKEVVYYITEYGTDLQRKNIRTYN